jgi:hypothetical protein
VVQAVDKQADVLHRRADGCALPLRRRRDRWPHLRDDRVDGAHGSLQVLDAQQRRRGLEQPLASA